MGILENWLKPKRLDKPVDLSVIKADMHSHLIPGIDDGAPDIDTSVLLIKKMKNLGFSKLITTPHIMVDLYKNTPENINQGFAELKQVLTDEGIDIELEVAAEYQLDDGFHDLLENDRLMSFSDNYILVELPYFSPPKNMEEIMFDLQVAGYKIILAHPERYAYWHNNFQKLEELRHRDILFQLNSISLSGYYSKATKKISEKLIDAEMIDFIGSDLHNLQYYDLLRDVLFEPWLEKLVSSGRLMNHLL